MRMTLPITHRDRALALGLLAMVLAGLYALLVHPWFTRPLSELAAETAALQERQGRVRAQMGQAGEVRRQLQQAQQVLAGQPLFLEQSSAALASSALLQLVEEVVLEASPGNRSCVISNRAPLPADGDLRFQKIAVQVRLHCGTQELARVLYALEGGAPALFVDNLTILAQRSAGSSPSGSGLDVTFDLSGYLRSAVEPNPAQEPANAR
jgi:general secretion pathway protein M